MKNTDKNYFERFSFGDSPEMADELLALVLAGKKTATVSVILEDEQAPSVGDLSLVLDGLSTPACVIKTVHVETVKFCDLTWDMVKLEGEDENFEQWKSGNIRYWKKEYHFPKKPPCRHCMEKIARQKIQRRISALSCNISNNPI